MANKVIILNKMPLFEKVSDELLDRSLANVAVDIVRRSKMDAPHDTGALSSSGKMIRKGLMDFIIAFGGGAEGGGGPDVPYALKWEYNTPPNGFKQGKKSHYLGDAAEKYTTLEHFSSVVKQQMEKVVL